MTLDVSPLTTSTVAEGEKESVIPEMLSGSHQGQLFVPQAHVLIGSLALPLWWP